MSPTAPARQPPQALAQLEQTMATKKMTEKQDAKADKANGIKEDSKRDMKQDKKAGVAPSKKPAGGKAARFD